MYNLENIKLKKIIESLIFSSPTPVSTKELMKFFSDQTNWSFETLKNKDEVAANSFKNPIAIGA